MSMFKELMKQRQDDGKIEGGGNIVPSEEDTAKDQFHKGYDLKQSDGYSGSSLTNHSK